MRRHHPPVTALPESNHTTHYSVMDADGNAVAVTTTINDWFGSRVTADGLGFCSTMRWTISLRSRACPIPTA
jgi:gamma-glutamyltranspeptidase